MSPLNHQQARQWIERAADGLLDAEQQAALGEHLATCAECRAYAAQLETLEGALSESLQARWGAAEMSPVAVEGLIERLQAEAPSSTTGGGPSSGGGFLAGGALRLIGLIWLLAMAILAYFAWLSPPAEAEASTTPSKEAIGAIVDEETQSPTATPSASASPTASDTPTPSELVLLAVPQQNVNCRYGNSSSQFDIADTLYEGESYTPLAKGPDLFWVYFRGPVTEQGCWAYIDNLQLLVNDQVTPIEEISDELLPFRTYPPTPTPTPTNTNTPIPSDTATNTPVPPRITPTCTPDGQGKINC